VRPLALRRIAIALTKARAARERAIADLSETIRLAPNHARALYVRGMARQERGIAAAKAIDAAVARVFAGDETN
jgi:hypothetical protein